MRPANEPDYLSSLRERLVLESTHDERAREALAEWAYVRALRAEGEGSSEARRAGLSRRLWSTGPDGEGPVAA